MATPAFDDDKEMNVLESSPSITVALIKDILQFMKCSENMKNSDLATIFRTEKFVEEQFQKRCHQVMIQDFFKKLQQCKFIYILINTFH